MRDANHKTDKSLIDKEFECIRMASLNSLSYKLDLKSVFDHFDTSGDGYLTINEMANAFLTLGVPLDLEMTEVLFK